MKVVLMMAVLMLSGCAMTPEQEANGARAGRLYNQTQIFYMNLR